MKALISNDDGIMASGILAAKNAVEDLWLTRDFNIKIILKVGYIMHYFLGILKIIRCPLS